MNRYIPDEIIESVRQRSDIVAVINSYLPLKRAGSTYKALCPFHQEKTPSFHVNPQRQTFHCFGCNKGGDVFRFVMEKEGVDFPNAIHILAGKCGVIIPETERSTRGGRPGQSAETRRDQRERLYKLHETICSWYSKNLKEHPDSAVGRYFLNRQIPDTWTDTFRLGAAPDSWDATYTYLKSEGFSEKEMLTSGLIKKSEKNPNNLFDNFRNRLIFPIWDELGRVIAFSARAVEQEHSGGKYINSPENPIFRKSKVLYALHLAREGINQQKFAILCEGQIDVIAMHRAGLTNAIAPQGTAFTDEQARIIKRYTDQLRLAFDADTAGIKAIIRAIDIALPIGLEIRVIKFPAGLDPDEIYKNQGEGALRDLVDNAVDFFEFLFEHSLEGKDKTSSWDINRIVLEMLEHISKIESSITRSLYVSKLAANLNIEETAIFSELNKYRRKTTYQSGRSNFNTQKPVETEDPSPKLEYDPRILKAEETLLELAIGHGTVASRLINELPSELISQTPVGTALEKIIQINQDGEWENSSVILLQYLNENPDERLAAILSNPTEYDHEHQEKAVTDCIYTIKSVFLEQDIKRLQEAMTNPDNTQDKDRLLAEFHQKCKELRSLRKDRRNISNHHL